MIKGYEEFHDPRFEDLSIAVLRIGGTNCDVETRRVIQALGGTAYDVNLNQLEKGKLHLRDYNGLIIPGGFSSGDYVRAGAIMAARIKAHIKNDLEKFNDFRKPIIGICNGFQILVELGLLPGDEYGKMTEKPTAILDQNKCEHYYCDLISVSQMTGRNTAVTAKNLKFKTHNFTVGHAEGRLRLANEEDYQRLAENEMVTFTYCTEDGRSAKQEFPINPNGARYDIAGICNINGNVAGNMPHPERMFFADRQLIPGDGQIPRIKRGDGVEYFKRFLEWARNRS